MSQNQNIVKSILDNLFFDREKRIPFKNHIKIGLIFSSAPALIIILFLINNYISYQQATFIYLAIFGMSLIFIHPYAVDLKELIKYVEDLTIDKNPKKPALSFINNLQELSVAIEKLNKSWLAKQNYLNALIDEDKILINSIPDILIMVNDKNQLIDYNLSARTIFGASASRIIAKILSDEIIQNSIEQIRKNNQQKIISYNLDNPEKFFIARFEKFPENSPTGISILIILQDITIEKKTQKMLKDFVANASHELKTPLTSISGFIETIENDENLNADQKNFLEVMKSQAERMKKLIADLLTLSVIETNSNSEKKDIINFPEIINETLKSLKHQIDDKKISVQKEFANDIPQIIGNRDELMQVADNLISNAIKYNSENGEIILKIFLTNNENYKFDKFEENAKLLCVSVIDSGEGIAEQYIPRLTERFFRIDKARSRKIGGSGLGLAIAKNIINNHNAHLHIESVQGKGSNFSIFFGV
ncbi:MAG: ATP-binding protein [Rickettsiales bacterium]|nr:ATP-binding protein [Rickettsiales bacterium]